MYTVDYGDHSLNVTWAGSLSLGANVGEGGEGGEGGSEDRIVRRSTNPSTPADVSLPDPAYPLARGGSTIYVNTTGRPQVSQSSVAEVFVFLPFSSPVFGSLDE